MCECGPAPAVSENLLADLVWARILHDQRAAVTVDQLRCDIIR
jgi:hypothetical protein